MEIRSQIESKPEEEEDVLPSLRFELEYVDGSSKDL